MRGYNVLLIYNKERDKILMCERRKEPFKGLLNFAGGKIEDGEGGLAAAYREMREETGITEADIKLYHLMDLTYYFSGGYLEVYAGRLNKDIEPHGEENKLLWVDAGINFFDTKVFAGGGNVGHIVEEAKVWADKIFAG